MSVSDTTALLSQSHSIIYGERSENAECVQNKENQISLVSIHTILIEINSKLSNIETKNNALEERLSAIEEKVVVVNEMQKSLGTMKNKIAYVENGLETTKKDLSSLESNVKDLGNVFDSVKEEAQSSKKIANSNKHEILKTTTAQKNLEDKVNKELREMREASESIKESLTDLKARSMRDNLIFTGIPEERWENTEAVLQDLLQKKYKLDYDIPFERVHRMGKWSEFKEQPRNIIAKFSYFKDREFIRKNAARKLKGSRIWVNEQFPPEIEEKRKLLYPVLRQAKKDHKRASLIRDTLYIEGEKYDSSTESAPRFYPDRAVSNYTTPAQSHQSGTAKDHQPLKRQRQGSTPDRY